MNDVENVIHYFYQLEFLNPFEPMGNCIYDSRKSQKAILPFSFQERSLNSKKKIVYSVYIGSYNYKNLLGWFHQELHHNYSFVESTEPSCILCGLKFNEEGQYLMNTFSLSSFPYGCEKIISNPDKKIEFSLEEMGKVTNQIFNEVSLQNGLTLDFVLQITDRLKECYPHLKQEIEPVYLIFKEEVYKKKNNEEVEATPAILSSFYLSDLKYLETNYNEKIKNFLFPLHTPKIEIESDEALLQKMTSPRYMPCGKWPSKNHSAFMQQVAIIHTLYGSQDVFSVNGPPGSGKTTLIKEIVATYIVKRARAMATFEKADDAFVLKKTSEGSYYALNDLIKNYSMLIVSNNNFAVENISMELPKASYVRKEHTYTDLFDTSCHDEIYFTDLANHFDTLEENWGLISVRLGKKANIQEFLNTLWYSKDFKTMRSLLNENHPQKMFWNAKEKFKKKWQEYMSYQARLCKIKEMVERLDYLENQENLDEFLEIEKKMLQKKLEKYKEEQIVMGDRAFFKDIATNKISQESSVWSSPKLEQIKEELFRVSLELHQDFLFTSTAFQRNLELCVNVLQNKINPELRRRCFTDVLNTLFLWIPVISTTLASVPNFLGDMSENGIALTILDEASQATPASTLGAIYRSKRVLVLGDPYQIEPVVSIPIEFYDYFGKLNQIPPLFKDITLSAQILADAENVYGGYRKDKWVGCPLLIHRRCENPMFQIANQICYDGKMFYCTKNEKNTKSLIFKSDWLDIKGSEVDLENHYVKEEGEVVVSLIGEYISRYEELPNCFIISPFKTVVDGMRRRLREYLLRNSILQTEEIDNWIKDSCGTIHTFQGKETDEVILLLGCSKNSLGAVKWASKKPNILNVAVTRAKRKILVLGNLDIWGNMLYYKDMKEILGK